MACMILSVVQFRDLNLWLCGGLCGHAYGGVPVTGTLLELRALAVADLKPPKWSFAGT